MVIRILSVQQCVVLDEARGMLLVLDCQNSSFSHELHHLADIKNLSVQTIRQNVLEDKKGKPAILTTQIGIEMT